MGRGKKIHRDRMMSLIEKSLSAPTDPNKHPQELVRS